MIGREHAGFARRVRAEEAVRTRRVGTKSLLVLGRWTTRRATGSIPYNRATFPARIPALTSGVRAA